MVPIIEEKDYDMDEDMNPDEIHDALDEDGDEVYEFGNPAEASRVDARIVVHDSSAFRDFAFGGSIGGAEGYMLGKWSSPNLLDVVRVFCINVDFLNQFDGSRPMLPRSARSFSAWS